MKKFIVFLLTLMMGFCTLNLSAQQTVEIGTGTSTTYYGPYNSLWGYSFVEQIYTAEEIDMAGSITSISFNNSSSGQTNNITVYMKLVNRTSFSSSSDYETVTAADVVYTGSHTFSSGWSTITLDTPFDYDGVSNLMIAVHEYTSGYSTQYFYYTSTPNALISFHSDNANPDPYNLGSYSGTVYTQSYRNNIQLEIMPSGNNCYAPLAPAVSDVTAYEATLSWTPREGQSSWEVYCGTGVVDLEQVSWTPVTDTFYTFTSLTPATNYTAYVRNVCDAEVSNPRQVPFTTEATCSSVPSAVTVSNITATTADVNWAVGEDDYAWEVVVVPANEIPESGTIEQTSAHPYTLTELEDNTQYKVYVRTDCGDGDHSYWSSPATFTTIPHCSSPLNVTVSQITASSALVTWQPAVFGATSYVVEYSLANEENWTVVPVDGTQLMLSGLEPDSAYNVMVYSICDLGTADTIHKDFITRHCLVGGDLQIGEGTATTNLFPTNSCYNYSYTQQIFLSSEMNGAADIHSIAFDVNSVAYSSRNISIYMMHTTAASSDWLNATTAQLVFNGVVNLVEGWNTVVFTTPFQYNGTENLALIIIDSTGSYSCSNYYNSHTTSSALAHCQYQDTAPYSINSIPTSGNTSATADRCNVIFGVDCNEDVTCVRPNVYVTETTPASVTLDWAPGYNENEWDVEYSVDNNTWESAGTANAHPYEVSNLNVDTRYYFRVRSNCGSDQSDWSGASARTECGPITNLPYFNNFDEVISDNGTAFVTCWSRYTTNPERVVRCYGSATHSGSYALDFNYSPSCTTAAVTPMIDPSIPLNTLMLDFWAYSSLGQGWMEVGTMSDPNDFSTYEFYDTVRLSSPSTWENVMISFENYTGSNNYIAFLEIDGTSTSYIFDDFTIDYIPNCIHPSNLSVDAFTSTTVTLSWTEVGNASTWAIEYGPAGFTLGEGTLVTAYENPFTIEDLTPATTYDFYVYSDCGGLLSDAFGPISATPGQYTFGVTGSDTLTTCGVMLYDNGGPNGNYSTNCNFTLVLYPENPDAMMAVVGTITTEGISWDYLTIYDGVGTSTQLAKLGGSTQTVNVMSQSGPLTLVFHTDGSVVDAGFAISATCVTCFPPSNIAATSTSLDGATLTWSGVGDSYVLFLNGDMTTGYDAYDTTYTFTGLNSSSVYSVQVAAICDGDTSMLSQASTFATACNAITITADNPWVENFESYATSDLICWETPVTYTADNGTFPMVYRNYGQSCHSGGNSTELKGPQLLLVLPEFTNSIQELRLSFWATATSTSTGNIQVGVLTDLNDTASFEAVADAGTPGPRGSSSGGNGNYMGPFYFNNTLATSGRIALLYTDITASGNPGASGNQSWNLDDFTVEIIPNCVSPVKTSVTASNIGGHVATITWVDNDDTHNAWTVFYKKTSESEWSTMPATDTTVTLTGLDPQTAYDVYVITNCGTTEDNPDATHTIHFTTTVACPAPTGLTLASVSTNEATITWNGTASSYNVEYGETGFTPGEGTIDVAYTESYTMTNLTPSTSYTFLLNSDCSDNDDGVSSTVSFTFTTTQIPAELPFSTDFSVANEWILNNGSCTNYWVLGTTDTTSALFVTDNGTTPSYTISSTSIVSAEKLFTIGNSTEFGLSFDVQVGGEGTSTPYDYLKVFLAPATSEFPAATSAPDFASYSYSTNAVDFSDYLSQTGNTTYPYKLSLTNGNTIHVEVSMPNPNAAPDASSTAKLVFVWKNDLSQGTQPGAIIYNVSLSALACPKPSNLIVSNIGMNTADLSWTPGGDETSWNVEYKEVTETSWTTVTAYSPSYQLTGLTAATSYDVRVQADCGSGNASQYAFASFHTTMCEAADQCTYTFNLTDSYGDGWNGGYIDVQQNGISVANIGLSSGSSATETVLLCDGLQTSLVWNSGSYDSEVSFTVDGPDGTEVYSASSVSSGTLTTFTTDCNGSGPVITDPTVTTGAASNIAQTTATLNGSINNPDNVTITAMGFEWKATAGGTYTPVTVTGNNLTYDLTNLTANTGYTYKAFITFNGTTVYGDEVTFTTLEQGQLTEPSATTNPATNVTQTTATLNGAITNPDNVTITAQGFEWKAASASSYTVLNATGSTMSSTLNNLTANTNYTYRAFVTTANGTHYGSDVTFTTLEEIPEPCDVPTNLHATDIQNEAISIAWDANANVNSWNVQYRPAAGGQWTQVTVNTNSYTITNLTGKTNYEIQVQANCGDGNLSDWSASITAQTTDVGIVNYLENSITLFPNPANDVVNVQCTMNNVQLEDVEVIDVYGKVVRTVVGANNYSPMPTRINVSGLANGMYFVRVTTDEGVATKTFIKK